MRRVKDAVDAALGVAILTALLLVATDAPVWLALLGPFSLGCGAFHHLTTDDTTGDDPR